MKNRRVRWSTILGLLLLAAAGGSYVRIARNDARPSPRVVLSPQPPGQVGQEIAKPISPETSAREERSPAASGGWRGYVASFARDGEIVSRRDAYARHFANPDGTVDALISASPIHYRVEDGTWQEIDTEVVSTRDGFENTKNNLQSRFPQRSTGRTTVGVSADRSYHWRPRSVEYDGSQVLWRIHDVEGKAEGEEVRYKGIFPGATDRYRILSSGVKHDLVLETRPTGVPAGARTVDYVGEVELGEGLAFYVDGERREGEFATTGVIWVCTQEGEKLFCLDRALAMEEGHPRSIGGRYVIRPVDHRRYEMRLEIPAAWILDPTRRYPVCIDPTTWVSTGAVRVASIYHLPFLLANSYSLSSFGDGDSTMADPDYGSGHWYDSLIGRDYDWYNEYYRSFAEWNTQSVPLSAQVDQVRLRMVIAPYNYGEFDSDRLRVNAWSIEKYWGEPVYSGWQYFEDCADGQRYLSAIPLRTGQGSTPWLALASSARGRLESQLNDHRFGVGFTWAEEGDRGVVVRLHKSILRVTYRTPPDQVQLLTPSNGARTKGNSVHFAWTAEDPDGDSLKYFLYCGAASSPSTLIYSGPAKSFTWTGAMDGTTYHWKVRASDGALSAYSPVRSFRENGAPPTPATFYPATGSLQPSGLQVVSWSVDSDPDGDVLTYQWRVDTSDPPSLPLAAGGTTSGTSSPLFSTAPGSTYYWTVRSYDGHEWSAWSSVSSFGTP